MKRCTVCKNLKPESDYFVKNKATNRLHAQCKQCYAAKRTAYQAQHYQKYGEAYRTRAKLRRKQIKQELQAQLLAYLSDRYCEQCGISDPRVLDFDHIDRAHKSFSISRALTDGVHWSKILAEIQKCQILCANCHRIRTATQFDWYRN